MKKVYSFSSLVIIIFFISCNGSNDNYTDRAHVSEINKDNFNSEVIIVNEMYKLKKEVKLNSGRIARIESSMEDSRDL